jgi:hypothetical protein
MRQVFIELPDRAEAALPQLLIECRPCADFFRRVAEVTYSEPPSGVTLESGTSAHGTEVRAAT